MKMNFKDDKELIDLLIEIETKITKETAHEAITSLVMNLAYLCVKFPEKPGDIPAWKHLLICCPIFNRNEKFLLR